MRDALYGPGPEVVVSPLLISHEQEHSHPAPSTAGKLGSVVQLWVQEEKENVDEPCLSPLCPDSPS